ncbi:MULTISPECIES: PKD domain-containing protein [Gluconobacter]|uniref:PKD domain-containing protein n=1 Tax=Gluconobacter TaxID=441 RepID=UPI0018D251BB|nr:MULTISPECIES: PKD domain-containing protein [Gluconobacter]
MIRTRFIRGIVGTLAPAPAVTFACVLATLPAQAATSPVCQAPLPKGALFITPLCDDPELSRPYIDKDKLGETTDPETGVSVRYRYVHGGFAGSKTKFAFYFPAQADYRGWFIESTYPTVTDEAATPATIVFGISHGAYVVSTNNNRGVPAGGLLAAYRANAAASKFSRLEATRIYGRIARPRGFIFGASGGAYQTLAAAENTSNIWDGSVPMVMGVPNSIPSFQSAQILGLRVLSPVLPQIVDAMAPGGSGSPFSGLTPVQQSTLQEVSRLGFPLRGWWQYEALTGGAFIAVEGAVQAIDPGYASDFWNKTGYEGFDPVIKALRIQATTSVKGFEGESGLVLANVPTGDLLNADLVVHDGAMAGTTLKIVGVKGHTVQIATTNGALANDRTGASLRALVPGTSVTLDNSWAVALQYYPRHQVPSSDEYGWNQYRDTQGKPRYIQRPVLVGPMLDANSSGGAVTNGRFHGRMIMLASTMDVQAFSWGADWYRKKAMQEKGGQLWSSYRLWYMDNADHDPIGPRATTAPRAVDHIVPYQGEYEQALLYLNDWVARDVAPPASTTYSISPDTQTVVTGPASRRLGVQPVVALTGNGREKIEVRAGQPVTFLMTAQVPPGTGRIVKVEWDLDGTGHYAPPVSSGGTGDAANLTGEHTFARPGVYFPTVRVSAAREQRPPNVAPAGKDPYALAQNLASVRVVVR